MNAKRIEREVRHQSNVKSIRQPHCVWCIRGKSRKVFSKYKILLHAAMLENYIISSLMNIVVESGKRSPNLYNDRHLIQTLTHRETVAVLLLHSQFIHTFLVIFIHCYAYIHRYVWILNRIKCLHRQLNFCSACCFCLIPYHLSFSFCLIRFSFIFISPMSPFLVHVCTLFRNGIDLLNGFFFFSFGCCATALRQICFSFRFVRPFFSSSFCAWMCLGSRQTIFISFFSGFFFFGSCEYGLRFIST